MHKAFEKRVLLITGKGGVGRTTISAGLAHAAAKAGLRVLLTEIGEPEGDYTPLARMFGRDTLPAVPERLAPGIFGAVLWPRAGHESFFHTVIPVRAIVRAAMNSGALRKLLDTAPSFREMGVFYCAYTHITAKNNDGSWVYDVVIVDMPASGHTLGLTGLPERLLALMPTGPIAKAMHDGLPWFTHPDKCGAYVVTLPETLPVTECLELIEGLHSTNTPIGGVLVNRVLTDPFTPEEREALTPVLADNRVYGRARFDAVVQAEEAMETLHAGTDALIHEIPEFPLQGEALLDAVTDNLYEPTGEVS